MPDLLDWLQANWRAFIIPVSVLVTGLLATLWVRRLVFRLLGRWRWPGSDGLSRGLKVPSILWCILISLALAVAVSAVPATWRTPVSRGFWTLFIVSMAFAIANAAAIVLGSLAEEYKAPGRASVIVQNIARIAVFMLGGLIILDLWGGPVTAVIIFMAIAAMALVVALRDTIANLTAGVQLTARWRIKVGDYIKLSSGEEGYIIEIGWRNICLEALDSKTYILPNSQVIRTTVTNFGHTLKQAKAAFYFLTRTHLPELTGMMARSLRELTDGLKSAPDSVVYYHTHRFLEEHHFLTPEPSNDFAVWVGNALDEEFLAEKLAAIDTFAFPTLSSLRDGLVRILEEHLATCEVQRIANPGNEFYFLKSTSVTYHIPYVAHDLREFLEALRNISLSSLYFHVFESRLRLGRGMNDFSAWLKTSLGEDELADEMSRVDPYTYTLEGLRSQLIQLTEKRMG